MPAVMSPKPKKIQVFISPNGQLYEGGAETYYGTNLGGFRSSDGVSKTTQGDEKKDAE